MELLSPPQRKRVSGDGFRTRGITPLTVAFLMALVCYPIVASSAVQVQSRQITVVYPSMSGGFTPLWIAHEKGLFAGHGININPVYIQGGSRAVQALIAKDADVAIVSGGVIEANLHGADLRFIAAQLPNLVFSLYARPEIRRIEGLRGKVVGVTRYGTPTMYSAILALRKNGMDPLKDVKILATGGISETLAAMQVGTVQAGILSAPVTLGARNLGFEEIVRIGDLGVPFIHDGIVASRTVITTRQRDIEAFLQGFIDGIRLYKSNSSLAEEIMSKYTRITDKAMLRETYETFNRALTAQPFIPREAISNMLHLITETEPGAAKANPENFMDDRLLHDLRARGYLNR